MLRSANSHPKGMLIVHCIPAVLFLESRLGLEFIGQHSVQDFRAETLVQAVSKQTVRDPCSRLIRPNWATDGSPVPPSPPVCFSEERRLLPEKGPAAGVKLARDDLV